MKPPRFSLKTVLAVTLFAITAGVFSPTLRYGLVDLDDHLYVASNPLVMAEEATPHLRAAFCSFQQGMYAPLLWLSYWLDAVLLRATPLQPMGFHFTNVLLQSLNAVLLYALLLAFCRSPWRAFFFAALWAIHPLRVESVAWITERKDVLAGFFGLLCLGAYLRHGAAKSNPPALRPSGLYYSAAVACLALGLLVKPTLVPMPGALLLLDYWPLRRFEFTRRSLRGAAPRLLAEKIPFFALAGLASYGAASAHQAMHALADVPLSVRLSAVPVHYVFYLAKFVWPRRLTPLYPDLIATTLAFGLAALLLAAMTAWVWVARARRPERLAGWLWFLGFLLPASGLVRFGAQSIADRFTYLPAMGLSIALISAWRTPENRAGRSLRPWFAAGVLALLAGATLRLLPAWRDPGSFHAHILSIYPHNPAALSMRSFYWIRKAGDFASAQTGFDRIIRHGAFNHDVLGGKARCLAELQGPAAAKAFLLQASATSNPYARQTIAWDVARYALMLHQDDDALRYAELALAVFPDQRETQPYLHLLAMAAAFEKGALPLALEHARRFPAYAEKSTLESADMLPYYLHQWTEFHRTDAWAYFQRLIQAEPVPPGLLNNLAWGLATADWSPAPPAEVLALAQRACAALPKANAGALDTLAAAQANAGDFPAAVATIQQALQLVPDAASPAVAKWKERLRVRLALYRRNQPYREDAFSRLLATQFGKGLPVTLKNTP